ncbi:hypothetical protein [Croceitalea rosinachiae]|uniref:Uncharacterized protein n=1 Tax=Croceitalea rosinachiae TaxID=3075596 RepID=A0ABU3ACX4_9FLAO|nr:hypothetical protein [Croceitalea sp. F388]MDT0608037.1 hypothetical protein [Croceitalea sp. F388]
MEKVEVIKLFDEYVGIADVQMCIGQIESCLSQNQKIKEGKDKIKSFRILVEKKIREFDPLLIGYLTLFLQREKDISITINFSKNPNYKIKDENSFIFQMRQYCVYAYISTGVYPELQFGGQTCNIIWGGKFVNNTYVASRSIFPLLFIYGTRNNRRVLDFELLFTKSLEALIDGPENFKQLGIKKLNELPADVSWYRSGEKMIKEYNRSIISKVNAKDRRASMIGLARMYFNYALEEAKIAHLYFKRDWNDENYKTKLKGLQAGNIKNLEEIKDYYDNIKGVFEELAKSSILHQIIYSTVLSTVMLKSKGGRDALTKDTKKDFTDKIIGLWKYTADVCVCLKEMAKNISEHSTDASGNQARPGALSIRRYSKGDWNQLRSADKFYKNYAFTFESEVKGILEVNAFDLGEIGVMKKLITDTQRLYKKYESNSAFRAPLEKDRNRLERGEVSLKDLIDLRSNHLNFQVKRSMAHLGLLILSKLIGENQGILSVASYGHNDSKDRRTASTAAITNDVEFPIEKGTIFNISLPIKTGETLRSDLPTRLKVPSETTAMEIKGIEALFKYEIIQPEEFGRDYKVDPNKIYIIQIFTEISQAISGREDEELWFERIQDQIDLLPVLKISGKFVFLLNFENSKDLDESHLFRLLGKMSLVFSSVPLIVCGLTNQLFIKLIRVNEVFNSEKPNGVSFWNENMATLVYSSTKIMGDTFYLIDVLWGKEEKDFIAINKMAEQVSFNSLFLGSNPDWIRSKEKELQENNLERLNPDSPLLFYNKNLPLPFDLILKDGDGHTYFEKNATVLLQNRLKAE